jgi:hypothetical protein
VKQLILYMEMVDGLRELLCLICARIFHRGAYEAINLPPIGVLARRGAGAASDRVLSSKRLSIRSGFIGQIPVAAKDLRMSSFLNGARHASQNTGKKSPSRIGTSPTVVNNQVNQSAARSLI